MRISEIIAKQFLKNKQQALKQKGQQLKRERAAFKLEKERTEVQQSEQTLANLNKPVKTPSGI